MPFVANARGQEYRSAAHIPSKLSSRNQLELNGSTFRLRFIRGRSKKPDRVRFFSPTASFTSSNSAPDKSHLRESKATDGGIDGKPPPRPTPNHLIFETSRYLVDSAYDEVRWYPWGNEAFQAARATQKPILLSTGFLSCHMCDVMSSHFRDADIAEVLNEKFVCIKVDREERPDVDSVYNSFVQAVTGRTGWPLTCFLTPKLVPFVGTTYLPKDRLKNAVTSIAERWVNSREQVESDGKKVIDALRDLFAFKPVNSQEEFSLNTINQAFNTAVTSFDVENGGFGSAPKFPRPSVFEFLLSVHQSSYFDDRIRSESLDMVLDSLLNIAAGGIHDHVGGGFFRYSLDASWQVPHFEKILSDQAQLAMSFLQSFLLTGDERLRQVVCKTLDFVMREMRDSESGALYSAIHADSQPLYDVTKKAAEGAFYTFSSFELMLILGEPANTIFQKRFGITAAGNVSESAVANAEYSGLEGLNILRISSSMSQIADEVGLPEEQVESILAESLTKVLEERQRRPRPRTDDLSITCWMALTISAFVRAGASLRRPDYIDVALTAANLIRERMVLRVDCERDAAYLCRAYRGKPGKIEAFAEDYAYGIQAFLDCYEVTGDSDYLLFARQLQNALDAQFWENEGYSNAMKGDNEILLRRTENYDGAEPAASSVAVLNFVRMSSLFGDQELWSRAKRVLSSFSTTFESSPLSMPFLLVSAYPLITDHPQKVVVVGSNNEVSSLLRACWSRCLPRHVSMLRLPLQLHSHPLSKYSFKRKSLTSMSSEHKTAFVCTGDVCLEPTADLGRFLAELDEL